MKSHITYQAIETCKQEDEVTNIGEEQESGYPSSITQVEHSPTKFLSSMLTY